MFQKLKVFLLSQAHEDEAMKERLDKNLVMLKRSNQIDMWEDRKMMAGMEWDQSINKAWEGIRMVVDYMLSQKNK